MYSGIWTEIIELEGEYADHTTTTMTQTSLNE